MVTNGLCLSFRSIEIDTTELFITEIGLGPRWRVYLLDSCEDG